MRCVALIRCFELLDSLDDDDFAEVDLPLDLTALDGAEVLVLPAVELGEHADHPHVVGLDVTLDQRHDGVLDDCDLSSVLPLEELHQHVHELVQVLDELVLLDNELASVVIAPSLRLADVARHDSDHTGGGETRPDTEEL